MLKRMYGYSYFIFAKFDKLPKQMVLYIGNSGMKMKNQISSENVKFRYQLKDIKEISNNELLQSESIDDNIIVLLYNSENDLNLLKIILEKVNKMPIRIDIEDHTLHKQDIQKGREEGKISY